MNQKTGYSRRKIREFQLLLPKAKKKSTRNRWETQTFPWGNDPNPQGILLGKPVTPQGRENRPSWSWFVQQQLEKAQEKKKTTLNLHGNARNWGGKNPEIFGIYIQPLHREELWEQQHLWGSLTQPPVLGGLETSGIFLWDHPHGERIPKIPPPQGLGCCCNPEHPLKTNKRGNKPTPKQGMEEDSRKKRRAGGAEFRAAIPNFPGCNPGFPGAMPVWQVLAG